MNAKRTLAVLLAAAALAACPEAPKPDPIPPTPKVASFTAAPATFTPGASVTLGWEVTDATTVTIADVSRGAVSGVENKLSGTVQVQPAESTLYVLSALNDRGAKATAVASVTRVGAQAGRVLFAAYPDTIPAGQKGTLVWSAPGARAVTITPAGGAALDLGGQVEAGAVEVDPAAAETTYTLSADGQTRTAVVRRAPEVTELTVSRALAEPGDAVTVAWKSVHGARAVLSMPGRGTLNDTTDTAQVALGSFQDTMPTLATGSVLTYRLSVTGAGGTAEKLVSVVLGRTPAITEYLAPTYARTGSRFTLSWKTTGADQVRVRVGVADLWSSTTQAQAAAGSLQLDTPSTDTTYTLVARSTAASTEVTQSRLVSPVGPATVQTFTATPTAIDGGGTAVTLAWSVPNARRLMILENGTWAVFSQQDAGAETGTTTVYPNTAATSYSLAATNTLEPAVSADAGVTVATPAAMAADGGIVFEAAGSASVEWSPAGNAQVYGLPHAGVDTAAASTGFVDISDGGTKLAFSATANDAVLNFTPMFQTFLYGVAVPTRVNVSTNGFLTFSTTSPGSLPTPATFPGTGAPANFVAPYWADLELTGPESAVYWQVLGDAPELTLVVQWHKARVRNDPTSEVTVQAKVHQSGVVTLEHKTLTSAAAVTNVVGVQGPQGLGVVGGAAAGGSVTFFGPRSFPVSLSTAAMPSAGFVKLGASYLRLPTPDVLRASSFGISEVQHTPAPAVTEGQWLEVRNRTAAPISLQGYTIDFGGGATHTIASPLVVPAGGFRVLGQTTNAANNDGVAVDYAWGASLGLADAGAVSLLLGASTAATATWAAAADAGVARTWDVEPVLNAAGALQVLTCDAARPYGTQVPQQLGTPGADSACFGYRLRPRAVSFFDISGSGAALAVSDDDDGSGAITLGANPINVHGTPTATLTVCTNGWIVAGTSTSTSLSNKTAPTTTAPAGRVIAPFWDDLVLLPGARPGSGIYSKRVAANEDPNNPGAHWIVQWNHVEHYLANDDLTFQVKFFDLSDIEFHYAAMTSGSASNYGDGNSATVWLDNAAGNLALPFSVNEPRISSNMAVRYERLP